MTGAAAISRETPETSRETVCSKCAGALDTTGSPRWCKSCRAAYHREYKELKEGMSETRGFSAGISAMRDCMATEFERLGSGMFAGYEIAELIRQAPGPERA